MIDVRLLSEYAHKGECFAITSYCNNETKLGILNKTIDNVRQYGFPIFLHAHYIVPEEIQRKVDFCFYSSDNPIFNRFNTFIGYTDGYQTDSVNWGLTKGYIMEITEYDHYYTTMKGWDESIKMLGDYEKIHMINYDTNVYPELLDHSKQHNKSIFLQHNYFARDKDHIFLLYFCLNKNMYGFFRENITLEKYIGYWAISKSKFLPHLEEMVGSFIHNNDDIHIVPFSGYSYDKMMEYDVSMDARFNWEKVLNIGNVKLFIGEYENTAHLLFFDVKAPTGFGIVTRKFGMGGKLSDHQLINLHVPFDSNEKIEITIDGIPVSDDFIKRFFRLESKIYPI